jgi:tetratricopeptide (TPR) repeat protein
MIPVRQWLPLLLLVAVIGGAAVVHVQRNLDTGMADYRIQAQELYLTSGEWVKRLTLGYDGLAACIYWTRAVQHFGREHVAKGQYRLLFPLLDITTTLDPELILAYRFGAVFLAEVPPHGPGQPAFAIKLLEKGLRQNPDYWRFWYDIGFVYYRAFKDYEKAAEAFRTGAEYPGAGAFMRIMAAKVAAEGGSRATARALWQELYKSTDDPTIRASAELHLLGLRLDDEIEFLQSVVDRYIHQTGKVPAGWRELAEAGVLPGQPLDPVKQQPYRLKYDGTVLVDPGSRIFTSKLCWRE